MGFLNVYVSNDANISIKNNQLLLQNSQRITDFPLEDLNSIMIENLGTNISTYTLAKLSELGVLTFICNENHLPCGIVLPFCKHYHTLTQFNLQINIPKTLSKQLWTIIIKNKIANQDKVLNSFGIKDRLKTFYNSVLNGDSGNNEAKASLIYFKELFGKNFIRRDDNPINTFLNYGYAIIRAFVARSITTHGLLPFLGISHINQYNQFNLADDLMEVFRPVVDLYVKTNLLDETKFTTTIKSKLYNLINYNVLVDGQKQTISYAIELFVQSYVKSLSTGKNLLKNIEIFGLELHQYE